WDILGVLSSWTCKASGAMAIADGAPLSASPDQAKPATSQKEGRSTDEDRVTTYAIMTLPTDSATETAAAHAEGRGLSGTDGEYLAFASSTETFRLYRRSVDLAVR
ncbi:hypothetical protein, partial [Mycolicibacterium sp. GF69]|uniref:hypothetical protein n=1 Tax=Mycolicibacterium sp. GF69 TaxID=2267251 RepID=UPI00197BF406